MEEEKLIVWFVPEDKRRFENQFHVSATGILDAITKCVKHSTFKFKVLGVSGWNNGTADPEKFKNNTFY
jgi:hypothetical protein